jgi:WD40 repeat protein
MSRFAALLLVLAVIPARADERDALPPGAVLRLGSLRWRAGGPIVLTAFRKDGRELLTVGSDHTAIVWDVATGRELRRFDVPQGETRAFSSGPQPSRVVVSADGRLLAALGRDRVLRLFDVDTGKQRIQVSNTPTNNVPALSADGKLLALYQQPGMIKIWDLAKDTPPETLSDMPPAHGGTNYVYRLDFAPDGKTLAQVGMQYKPNGGVAPHVVLWDVLKMERIKQHDELPDGAPRDATMSAFPTGDGKSLVIPLSSSIAVMDLTTGKERGRLKDVEQVEASAFVSSPDGRELVQLIGRGEALVVWDLVKGEVVRRFGKPDPTTAIRPPISSLALSPDRRALAFGDGALVTLIDLQTGKKSEASAGHATGLMGVYYSPDGKSILTRADQTFVRWDSATGKLLERFDIATPLSTFLLTRDAKWMVAVGPNMQLHVIDSATRQTKHTFSVGSYTYTFTVAPDSRTLIVLTKTGPNLQLFDVTTGVKTVEFPLPSNDVESDNRPYQPRRLNTTRDSRLVVGSTENSLIVWDLLWRREVQRIDFPAGKELRYVTFGPDGRTLAVEFYDGEIGLWEVASGRRRRLLARSVDESVGGRPSDRMQVDGSRLPAALAYSLDGRLIANAGPDRVIRLFDARGGEVGSFTGHRGPVTAVSFSPDSTRLVSACADSTALVWDLASVRAKLPPAKAETATPEDLWARLGEADAEKAYDAILALAADAPRAVTLLRQRLAQVPAPEGKMLARLMADLDSAKYAERQKAKAELEKLGDLALPALKRALDAGASAEVHATVRKLMEALATRRFTVEEIRQARAVEALELMAAPEARELLKLLAEGAAAAPQTIDAKLALERHRERQ